MLRVPMLDETELPSYGLKSSENVTPVVGSAIRGFPPDVVDVEGALQATARNSAATPTRLVMTLRFIYLSTPRRFEFADGNTPHWPTKTAETETPDAQPSFLTAVVSVCRVGRHDLKTR